MTVCVVSSALGEGGGSGRCAAAACWSDAHTSVYHLSVTAEVQIIELL